MVMLEKPFEQNHLLFVELTQRYHFTASAKAQLYSLLQRWAVLMNGSLPQLETMNFKHSKALLAWLEQQLTELCWR